MLSLHHIKESATKVGFDLCGATPVLHFGDAQSRYMEWLESGQGEALPYMHKYMEVRFDPAEIMEGCKSAVVCAINYKNSFSLAQRGEREVPKIASYALNADYHNTIRRSLKALLRELKNHYPTLNGRCCVDTAPLLEKHLATRAGLGWIGRQSLLVTEEYGSFVVLGVLLLDDEVDNYDAPYEGKGCAECRACLKACPNGAISDNRTIDSRLCISAQSVECDTTKQPLRGWIFGCDECQMCCPHNQHTPMATNPAMQPIFAPISYKAWQSLTAEEFTAKLNKTPLKRAGLERILRNLNKN